MIMVMMMMVMMMMMLMMTTPVNEVANPGTEDENGNGADQPVHCNQLEAVRLKYNFSSSEAPATLNLAIPMVLEGHLCAAFIFTIQTQGRQIRGQVSIFKRCLKNAILWQIVCTAL